MRPLSFSQKIAVLVFLTLTVTGLVNWSLAGWVFYQTTRDQVLRSNQQVAETVARRVEDVLTYDVGLLRVTARDPRLAEGPTADPRELLPRLRGQMATFDSLSLIGTDGRLRAIDPPDPGLIGSDLSGRDYVREILGGRQAFISDAFQARTGRLVAVISVPVVDAEGRLAGVLSGSLHLHRNNSLARLLNNVRVGREGILYAVDRHGRILYHPDQARIMGDASGHPAVGRVLAGKTGAGLMTGENGRPVLAAYAPVSSAGWGVIAQVPSEEALDPLQRFNRQTFLVSLVTLGLALLVALLVSRRLLRPLHHLVRALRAVSRGDFQIQFPAPSRDEWGVLAAVFNRMVAELGSYHRELEQRATTDALTGLYNRGFWEERIELELQLARRIEAPLSLLMMDIDDFKTYNDSFGHQAGDDVLAICAGLFRKMVREGDWVARYGGEEFAVILPNAGGEAARGVAERIRCAVAKYPFEHRQVTISIGGVCFPEHGEDAALLMARADAALYQAKRSGKNRFVLWTPTQEG